MRMHRAQGGMPVSVVVKFGHNARGRCDEQQTPACERKQVIEKPEGNRDYRTDIFHCFDGLVEKYDLEKISERLKAEQRTLADQYNVASILFADVVEFTPMAATPATLRNAAAQHLAQGN
jgi:hypothetical protein